MTHSRLALLLVWALALPRFSLAEGEVRALFFHSDGCDHCSAVMAEVIPPLQASFPLEVRALEISDPGNRGLMVAFQRAHKTAEGEVPALVVGDVLLQGEAEIRARLLDSVLDALARGGTAWPTPPPAASAETRELLDLVPPLLSGPGKDACGPGDAKKDTCRPAETPPGRP